MLVTVTSQNYLPYNWNWILNRHCFNVRISCIQLSMSPDIRAIPGVLNVTQDYINPFVVSKEFSVINSFWMRCIVLIMEQRLSRGEKAEEGGECVNVVRFTTDTHRPHGGAPSSSWRDETSGREKRREKREKGSGKNRRVCLFFFSFLFTQIYQSSGAPGCWW